LGCEPVPIETSAATRWAITVEALLATHARRPLKGVLVASPANPTGTMMTGDALGALIAAAEGEGIRFISDEIYHGLDYAFAAQAAFDGRDEMEAIKHGYEENRRLLTQALPKAGLEKFLPVDGAFYLYADVSRFSNDSLDFAKRMLEQAGVAATPGIDFDPVNGHHFVRFCYAGSNADMSEAVQRIAHWLAR